MIWFIIAIILFIIAIAVFAGRKGIEEEFGVGVGVIIGPIFAAIAILLIVSFYRGSVSIGEVGIPVTLGQAGEARSAGPVFGWPLTDVKTLSVRTEEYTMTVAQGEGAVKGDDSIEVKGRDGATGHVDGTLLYRLVESEAPKVYATIGTDYLDKIIRPTARTCVRDAFAGYNMVDASTTNRGKVSEAINDCLRKNIEPRGFVIEDFQLRNVRVDENVQKAIDAKVAAEQEAQRKAIELQAASAEAEKKRIEAKGTSDAQQIIKCGATIVEVKGDGGEVVKNAVPKDGASCENNLTPEFLQYQYIQSLQSVVNSPNNSTIILPMDQNITPLLNVQK